MKVLVTGGAGFIGSHLIAELLRRGDSVAVIDNLSTGSESNIRRFSHNPRYKFVFGDVAEYDQLESLIQDADVIFHLAACVGVQNVVNDPIHCIETNINGTSRMLKLASPHKKRIFTFSTSEVYGKSTRFPYDEADDIVLGPVHKLRWSYAASKLVDDFLAQAYFARLGTPVTIVRLFNTIGLGQLGHYGMVVPRFFNAAMSGKPLSVYGTGKQTRCFTDVRDVVAVLLTLIPETRSHGELINVGNDEEISILDLASQIKTLTNSNSPIQCISFESAYGQNFEDMERRVPSTAKLKRLTGFEFAYRLRDTMSWIHHGLQIGRQASVGSSEPALAEQ